MINDLKEQLARCESWLREEPNDQDIALCAKHFFELGMRVSNKV